MLQNMSEMKTSKVKPLELNGSGDFIRKAWLLCCLNYSKAL